MSSGRVIWNSQRTIAKSSSYRFLREHERLPAASRKLCSSATSSNSPCKVLQAKIHDFFFDLCLSRSVW